MNLNMSYLMENLLGEAVQSLSRAYSVLLQKGWWLQVPMALVSYKLFDEGKEHFSDLLKREQGYSPMTQEQLQRSGRSVEGIGQSPRRGAPHILCKGLQHAIVHGSSV